MQISFSEAGKAVNMDAETPFEEMSSSELLFFTLKSGLLKWIKGPSNE
jgi:hypothetical protein